MDTFSECLYRQLLVIWSPVVTCILSAPHSEGGSSGSEQCASKHGRVEGEDLMRWARIDKQLSVQRFSLSYHLPHEQVVIGRGKAAAVSLCNSLLQMRCDAGHLSDD